jgi:translation initiation factor 2B subunit (eIF-2B alpha/beta/delta family)
MNYRLENLANYFVKYVEQNQPDRVTKIVTLSASGTITTSLSSLIKKHSGEGRKIKLTVMESRPKFEGVTFVNKLLSIFAEDSAIKSCLEVDIVSDAGISSTVQGAHYLLLGADKVLPNGDVSNKIGSFTAAIVARTLNPACKVLALHETDKIVSYDSGSDHEKVEYNDSGEVTVSWPRAGVESIMKSQEAGWNIQVKNAYFEWVPENFIDAHISEEGIMTTEDVGRISIQAQGAATSLFGDM